MLSFESNNRAAGEDVLSQFMPRHEDLAAVLEADVDHVDLVVMTTAQVEEDGLGAEEPYWSVAGIDPADLFLSPPVGWDLDPSGYNVQHRLAWGAEDDDGRIFEPTAGATLHLYFYFWRTDDRGPVVVHHAAGFAYSPRWAVSP